MKTNQRLSQAYKNALVIPFDESSKYAFLSDVHRGDDSVSDEFTRNQNIYLHALNYYYNQDYTYIEVGCYFPLKIYGDYAFPPGNYEALRVKIGAAEGKNWWCVMFPPLCFVDETYSVVDEKSGKKLKKLLTDEEYQTLIKEKKPVKIKFKLWEKIKKLFH
jgi:stage II sporulation protein R